MYPYCSMRISMHMYVLFSMDVYAHTIISAYYVYVCTLVDAYMHMHVSIAFVHSEVSGPYM